MNIRAATADDAPAIAAIYNHYVMDSTISFEEAAVSDADMAQRIGAVHDAGLPWLVASDASGIVAYAYATKWRVRHAYRYSVESTIYVRHDAPGRGFGLALYTALLEKLQAAGVHVVIGGIAQPNAASVALHEKCGFEQVAMFAEVGFKCGRWIDVGYWQLKLGASTQSSSAEEAGRPSIA